MIRAEGFTPRLLRRGILILNGIYCKPRRKMKSEQIIRLVVNNLRTFFEHFRATGSRQPRFLLTCRTRARDFPQKICPRSLATRNFVQQIRSRTFAAWNFPQQIRPRTFAARNFPQQIRSRSLAARNFVQQIRPRSLAARNLAQKFVRAVWRQGICRNKFVRTLLRQNFRPFFLLHGFRRSRTKRESCK